MAPRLRKTATLWPACKALLAEATHNSSHPAQLQPFRSDMIAIRIGLSPASPAAVPAASPDWAAAGALIIIQGCMVSARTLVSCKMSLGGGSDSHRSEE